MIRTNRRSKGNGKEKEILKEIEKNFKIFFNKEKRI